MIDVLAWSFVILFGGGLVLIAVAALVGEFLGDGIFARSCAWLWEKTERARARLDVWAIRLRIRLLVSRVAEMPVGPVRDATIALLSATRRRHAALARYVEILDGIAAATVTPSIPKRRSP